VLRAVEIGAATIYHADCIEVMPALESVDSVVTDPPYGIRFMGQAWDGEDIVRAMERRRSGLDADPNPGSGRNGGHRSPAVQAGTYRQDRSGNIAFQEWTEKWAREAFRVLKPGGYLISFSSTRTYHRMASGIEDAGFEIRDQIGWAFGTGFPKSKNLAGEWAGWGTALKPAWEPIVVARKPLIGTVEANVAEHGVGALNIDACRIDAQSRPARESRPDPGLDATRNTYRAGLAGSRAVGATSLGRWPANLCHDGSDEVVALFPESSGQQASVGPEHGDRASINTYGDYGLRPNFKPRGDSGSAARFFYCAKSSPSEREAYNKHPTVKPVALMRWLCQLVTPPGGTVLDPFAGSGSTGIAAVNAWFRFIGIEREQEYFNILTRRLADATQQQRLFA